MSLVEKHIKLSYIVLLVLHTTCSFLLPSQVRNRELNLFNNIVLNIGNADRHICKKKLFMRAVMSPGILNSGCLATK